MSSFKGCFFAILLIIFSLTTNEAFAQDNYSNITNDAKLMRTLDFLSKTSQKSIINTILGDNLSGRPMRLMFRNLAELNYNFRNYDALACTDNAGNLYILINTKHKDAPIEAIVSLLSHEVIHQDHVSSIEEEVQGWLNEAKTWIAMKKLNPELNNVDLEKYPLVKRLNAIEKMYKEANYTTEKIQQEIASNYAYKDLAMYSPGYGI